MRSVNTRAFMGSNPPAVARGVQKQRTYRHVSGERQCRSAIGTRSPHYGAAGSQWARLTSLCIPQSRCRQWKPGSPLPETQEGSEGKAQKHSCPSTDGYRLHRSISSAPTRASKPSCAGWTSWNKSDRSHNSCRTQQNLRSPTRMPIPALQDWYTMHGDSSLFQKP